MRAGVTCRRVGHHGGMRDGLVVVGGSAGAVPPLIELVAGLPSDFAGCVLVTLHMPGHATSSLAAILDRAGPLPAVPAHDGAPMVPGRIVVAVPDSHLLVADGILRLGRGPRVNRHRPAVDVTFTGAAAWGGQAVTAVVLSGVLDDGAVGAALVDASGGRVVIQDPEQAEHRAMPEAALRAVPAATVSPTAKLAEVVSAMARDSGSTTSDRSSGAPPPEDPSPVAEAARAAGDPSAAGPDMAAGSDPAFLTPAESRLTRISCPECQGPLAEMSAGNVTYYRCHIGHQYGLETLVAAQADAVESKLWVAVAALEEQATMARHLAERGVDPATHRATADSAAELAGDLRARLRHPS